MWTMLDPYAINMCIMLSRVVYPGECRTLPAGLEYELKDAQEPHLFIICKQRRNSASSVSSLRYYYILDGNVYQAPSLHVALASRLVSPLCTSHCFTMLLCSHRGQAQIALE